MRLELAGLVPCLLAEQFRQALLKLAVVLGQAGGALVGGGEVGDERGAADSRSAGLRGRGLGGPGRPAAGCS